jgi:hypothetical protein
MMKRVTRRAEEVLALGGVPGTGGERAEGDWGPKRSKGKLKKQSDPHWHDVNILI